MNTQIQDAKINVITDEMKFVAEKENVSAEFIRDGIVNGSIVILKNNLRTSCEPVGIGEGLTTKILTSVGISSPQCVLKDELDKARIAQHIGTDVLMDNTTCGDFNQFRNSILSSFKVPFGSDPLFQLFFEAMSFKKDLTEIKKDDFLNIIKKHCSDGVDFIYLYPALTLNLLTQLISQDKLNKLSSVCAILLGAWMKQNNLENPIYSYFDDILNIVSEFNVTLILGSSVEANSTFENLDSLQILEQAILGNIVKKARQQDVQVIVEGLNKLPLNKIQLAVQNLKELTDNIPLYSSGSIVCDCAIGHNNITSAIGGAFSILHGVNMLKATSPTDGFGFDTPSKLKDAIISAKIACNCADLAKGNRNIVKQNYKMSYAKKNFDFDRQKENSIDKSVFDGLDYSKDIDYSLVLGYSKENLIDKYFS